MQDHKIFPMRITSEKAKKYMNIIISISVGVGAVSSLAYLIYNNIWKPYVTVIDVDYDKPFADLHINGFARELYPNAKISAGGDWAVRFNSSSNDPTKADRIELIRGDVVHTVIDEKPKTEAYVLQPTPSANNIAAINLGINI
jgi:hypothetical protein